MTSNLANAFQSERLVYTAIEDTDEVKNWFHERFENEPVGRAFADSSLLRPQPKSRSEEVLADIRKSLLGVLICLPPDTDLENLADRDKSQSAGADPAVVPKPKPTPIGVLHLDDESVSSKQLPDNIPTLCRTRISQPWPVTQRPCQVSGSETGYGHLMARFPPHLQRIT